MPNVDLAKCCGVSMVAMLGMVARADNARFEYAARAGVSYSDNIGRAAINEVSSASAVVGVQLAAVRPSGRLRYNVSGDLSYNDYFQKGFDSELLGQLQASSSYEFIPESFLWNADASFGQARQDLQRAAAPGNREALVTFSTGPELRAHFGTALEASLDSRYTLAQYSKRGYDNQTVGARLVLGHRPSANTLLGAGVSYDDVSYSSRTGVATTDYKRSEAFLRYDTTLVRTQLNADAGYSSIKGGGKDSSGPLLRMRATRRLTPFISAYAAYSQEYPTSQNDAILLPGGIINGGDAILSATPRLSKNTSLGVLMNRPRTTLEITFGRQSQSAELGGIGKLINDTAAARISRALTPRSSVGGFVSYTREDFGALAPTANESAVGGEFSRSFGTSFGVDVRVEYHDRSSDSLINRYKELSGGVFLTYGRVRQPAAMPNAR